ncbi:MAG: potassium channel family protein [Candidatus Sedimenticola sp. (ex Thyasira tokunagai)]
MSGKNPIYSSISLVLSSIFIFSIIIYLTQALTDNLAFCRIHPIPENNYMTIICDPISRLCQIPPLQTIFDCIYYSFSLMTGSGVSDAEPVTNLGKTIVIFEISMSIGLIAIVLSAAVGRVYENQQIK